MGTFAAENIDLTEFEISGPMPCPGSKTTFYKEEKPKIDLLEIF